MTTFPTSYMMTTNNHSRAKKPLRSGTPSSSFTLKRKRGSRLCRAYQQRTLNYVRTSLDRWSFVFSQPEVSFSPEFQSCSQLAQMVKALLADCPSEDVSMIMAFQSIKKGLPDSCSCMEAPLLRRLEENIVHGSPPVLPRGYLQFVKKEVSRLFPKGWDTSYEGFCRRAAPPLSGTLSTPRSSGGSLHELTSPAHHRLGLSQSDFLDVVLGNKAANLGVPQAALQVVQSAGKPRPLTTFSADTFFLKPLHKTIYKRLSQQKWLCRGDVTPEKLRAAGFRKSLGGFLTSGDYASATDNLSIEVYETCLSVMLENSCTVPKSIIEYALAACRPTLYPNLDDFRAGEKVDVLSGRGWNPQQPLPPIRKGQMMGSLLSFPLLCLQNFLAFRWSARGEKGKIPVIINGDDILFQSSESLSKRWMACVGQIGLQVEPTKTSVERDWGTLNSTLFRFRGEELMLVPTLRFGMLRAAEFPHSLGASFHDFVKGQQDPIRWRAGHVWFEAHLGELKALSYDLPSVGFRGCLAHRLAVRFGVLDGARLSGELPRAPESHSMGLPSDLICEVPLEFVDSEIQDLNASETAAWKWSTGYQSARREREAILYCLAMTRFRYPDVTGDLVAAMTASEREFAFRWGDRARLTVGRPSRKTLARPFYAQSVPRVTVRVHWRIVEETLRRAEWFWGPLPTYDEAVGGCG